VTVHDKKKPLASLLGSDFKDRRYLAWLWLYLNYCEKIQLNPSNFDWVSESENIYRQINRDDCLISRIMIGKTEIVPDINIQWIGNDLRQISIVDSILWDELQHRWIYRQLPFPARFSERECLIAAIDLLHMNIEEKIHLLNRMEDSWNLHVAKDKIYNWFKDEKPKERCEFAFEWANKNEELVCSLRLFEKWQDVASYLEGRYENESDKIVRIDKIKKAWSQKCYREKQSGKKQYNFILTDEAIKSLNDIAKKNGLKKTEVLEIILRMEKESGTYIAERLRRKKLLME